MKLLYIGTVTEEGEYNNIVNSSRVKPSVAPQAFESAFIKGLKNCGVEEMQCFAFPMIASFPNSKLFSWGKRKQTLFSSYPVTWIPTINLPYFKMKSQGITSVSMIKKWLKQNGDSACVLMYSIYGPVAKHVVALCKKYHAKCVAFVPDLPKHMYLNQNGLKKRICDRYIKSVEKIQGQFDGYIYLTDEMKYEISDEKPYIVMEGIMDDSLLCDVETDANKSSNVIMYAGSVSARYGLPEFIEAFTQTNIQAEVHIYGYGDFCDRLEQISTIDSRIRYMGRISRDVILKKEREATLLVNVRNPDDEFTKFSFPSKTIEYMASGTPLLTTSLSGIPKEYFEHCFSVTGNSVSEIKSALENIFSLSEEERQMMGKSGRDFIINHKSNTIQAQRILDFLYQVLDDSQ